MKEKLRSATGAVLMLMIIPTIVGLLACMPVPIGDPERSRVDPTISGVWTTTETSADLAFYAFEPYDKRTWLLTGMPLAKSGDAAATKVALYKAWTVKLAGERFMTWEPKAMFENAAFEPEVWFVFRVERRDDNTLDLYLVNSDAELFKEVAETRRAYERVIRKNVKDPSLYSEEPIRMLRLKPEQRELFEDLADEVISFD